MTFGDVFGYSSKARACGILHHWIAICPSMRMLLLLLLLWCCCCCCCFVFFGAICLCINVGDEMASSSVMVGTPMSQHYVVWADVLRGVSIGFALVVLSVRNLIKPLPIMSVCARNISY